MLGKTIGTTPFFYYFDRDQSRHPKRDDAANDVHALSAIDQAHTLYQPCDVGSAKNSPEVHILPLMRENIYKEVSNVNQLELEYIVEHQKVIAPHNSYRVQQTPNPSSQECVDITMDGSTIWVAFFFLDPAMVAQCESDEVQEGKFTGRY